MAIVLSTSDSAKLEPKRSNRWLILFNSIPGGGPGSGEAMSFVAYKGKRPEITFEAKESFRINEKWRNGPGHGSWGDLEYSFYDFITNDGQKSAYSVFMGWQNKIYDPLTGQMGYKIEYITHATVGLLDPKGTIVSSYHIFYMWPKSIKLSELDMSNDEILSVDVTFTYDYAVPGTELGANGLIGESGTGETYPVSNP